VPRGPLLGAIADDVTGATDLCSTLVREGMRVVQTMGAAPDLELPEVDAVVVGLKTRTAPVDDAVRESLHALAWLRELGAGRFFFKYCSTFDSTPAGNIGPVADALLDALGADLTVVCPAYPANGRTLYEGHLFVHGRLLSESSLARHPLTPMTDPDIVRFLGLQTERPVGLVPYDVGRRGAAEIARRLGELREAGVGYAVTDALEDDDLRAIGEAAADLPLVTGGAGVAIGLPEGFRRQGLLAAGGDVAAAPRVDGPAVVLAGSSSEATQEQVRRMADRFPALAVGVDTDLDTLVADVRSRLADGPVLVHATASADEVARVQARVGAAQAGALLESLLSRLAARLVAEAAVRRIVVAGGETSGAVASALGIRALAVGREIAPGVPWMTSLGDPALALAFKSGNFGGPDFFLEALEVA
jgi:uncharacterized protein YgbK (DUF1537 family)